MLIGDYDEARRLWARQLFDVEKTNYPDPSNLPRQGDLIRLKAQRSVVVLDFANSTMERIREPPWQGGVLKQADYTPYKLPGGMVLEVREVSMPHYPHDPAVVWARVAKPPR